MTLQVIVGGQAGSEGKGAVAAYLAARSSRLLAVRVAGPNAGHTVIGVCPTGCPDSEVTTGDAGKPGKHPADSHPWRLRHVPVAAVTNPDALLALAAGSEIDIDVLVSEIDALDSAGYDVSGRLVVDDQATVIDQVHKDFENGGNGKFLVLGGSLVDRIGSTGKGIGAARAARAMRDARLLRDADLPFRVNRVASVAATAASYLDRGDDVQVEGTQGYLLGQHAGHYPKCTSSDCTAIDFLSMAGISPWQVQRSDLEVWVTFRTYPIRVAGESGPLYGETTWEALGLEPELTTVTRKVRRVGRWNGMTARSAMFANGHTTQNSPCRAALTMADYVIPEIAGRTTMDQADPSVHDQLYALVASRASDIGCLISLVGTGPGTMIDLRKDALDQGRTGLVTR